MKITIFNEGRDEKRKPEVLNRTDVLVYWSHGGNDEFPDYVA